MSGTRFYALWHKVRYLVPPWNRASVSRFSGRIRSLPPLAKVDEETEATRWSENRRRFRERVLSDDPRKFLRWPEVATNAEAAPQSYIFPELATLRSAPDWERWRKALTVDRLGTPRRMPGARFTSANRVHQAYHLYCFEQATGMRIGDFGQIVEVGGGYGAMCRVAHNLGFSGRYILFDLPEFLALQEFYLSLVGQETLFAWNPHDIALLMEDVPSLFIATWSLSEIPVPARKPITDTFDRFNAFCIAYQAELGIADDIDNDSYFRALMATMSDVDWTLIPLDEYLPTSRYLFGH